MHYPRFIFLAVLWMLVSPNNRPLGRSHRRHATYDESRDAVVLLREQHHRLQALPSVVEVGGRWSWVVDLDGTPVAVSNRSYLRARECSYNLERFMQAVPTAEIVTGTRVGRRRAGEADQFRFRSARVGPRSDPRQADLAMRHRPGVGLN